MATGPIRDLPTMDTFDFPVYEVVTPHTKKHFLMKSMTIAQESVLKESSVSAARVIAILNQTLFECADGKEPPYDTITGFEKNLTIADRRALLAGLFIASYGEEQEFEFTCPRCNNRIKMKVNVPSSIDYVTYDGTDNIIEKRFEVELPISKWKAILKVPTLADEKAFLIMKNIPQDVLRRIEDYQVIEKLIVPAKTIIDPDSPDKKKKKVDLVSDNVVDIYSKLKGIPARDRKALFNTWFEVFGGPKLSITVPVVCNNCETETKFDVNPSDELFRQLS